MTLFLRTKENKTICECDFFTDENGSLDVVCGISVINYTELIFKFPYSIIKVASAIEYLYGMRGFLWECNKEVMGKDGDKEKAIAIVRKEYEKVAQLLDLSVVED